jgi:hypothetical protein
MVDSENKKGHFKLKGKVNPGKARIFLRFGVTKS